ncbi:hypothetical protein BMG_5723 (plasmid) [Priestia megaterium]|nr:hypothetical protein BMG_5723 [Priestia megaterium]
MDGLGAASVQVAILPVKHRTRAVATMNRFIRYPPVSICFS